MIPLHKQTAAQVVEALGDQPNILSAYLFGSVATGHSREASDCDIAVRLTTDLDPHQRFQLRLELIDRIEKILDRPVDIVIMNDAALLLIHQVFSAGIRLFVRDPADEERYNVLKEKEFFDFRYYIDRDFDQMRQYFGVIGHD